MIKNSEIKIYNVDNDWNRIGSPIRKDFSNTIIDKIKKITITFVDGTRTKINTVQSFEYDSDFNIIIRDALFNITLYNAMSKGLEIKNIKIEGIITDCEDNFNKYCFETRFRYLKVVGYNGTTDLDGCYGHEYTLVDINEEL